MSCATSCHLSAEKLCWLPVQEASLHSPIITFTIIPIQSPYCDCVLIVISVAKGCASWRNSLPIPSACNNIGSSQLTALLPGGGFINELVANQLKLPWDLPRWSKMEKQISPHSRVMCPIDISSYCPISQQCQIKIELGTIRSCLCYGWSSPPPRRELKFLFTSGVLKPKVTMCQPPRTTQL